MAVAPATAVALADEVDAGAGAGVAGGGGGGGGAGGGAAWVTSGAVIALAVAPLTWMALVSTAAIREAPCVDTLSGTST